MEQKATCLVAMLCYNLQIQLLLNKCVALYLLLLHKTTLYQYVNLEMLKQHCLVTSTSGKLIYDIDVHICNLHSLSVNTTEFLTYFTCNK